MGGLKREAFYSPADYLNEVSPEGRSYDYLISTVYFDEFVRPFKI